MPPIDLEARLWRIWKRIKKLLGGCEHFWRPAALSVNRKPYIPAKVCDDCGKIVPMQISEFYALFGRMPW